jgi:hypothetical protein
MNPGYQPVEVVGELLVERPDADQQRRPGPRPPVLDSQLSATSPKKFRSPKYLRSFADRDTHCGRLLLSAGVIAAWGVELVSLRPRAGAARHVVGEREVLPQSGGLQCPVGSLGVAH